MYHLSRPAGYRTPASSSAYQAFSAFSDVCVLPLYAYGALAAHNNSGSWTTLLSNDKVLPYLITSFYYTLIGAGGLHLLTLTVAFWLAIKFRQIAQMPPDLNPLADRYTTRTKKYEERAAKQQLKQQHARNKSSIATADTYETLYSLDNDKGLLSRPPSVPFLHTRMGSQVSMESRDPRLALPSQNSPANSSRISFTSMKRAPATGTPNSGRGEYAEIPLNDGGYSSAPSSRTSYHGGANSGSGSPASARGLGTSNGVKSGAGGRQTAFTENWYASDSVPNLTQQRNRALNTMVLNASGKRRNYAMVNQSYDFHDSDVEASDSETVRHHAGSKNSLNDENVRYDNYDYNGEDSNHPNPLRSNPLNKRPKTPFYNPDLARVLGRPLSTAPSMSSSVHTSTTHSSILGEVPLNDRRVSGGYTADITDAIREGGGESGNSPSKNAGRGLTAASLMPPAQIQPKSMVERQPTKRWTWAPRNRDSSIQPDEEFFSKPYGELKSATPPIIVGEDLASGDKGARQVSSGNDYDLGSNRYLGYGDKDGMPSTFGRRNVSGKIAEEGRAYSRYSTLNDN